MLAQSLKSPWTRETLGLEASFWAAGEEGFRVRARIEKGGLAGESRRALTTAPPCLPVAPVMRRVWGEDMMDGCARESRSQSPKGLRNSELLGTIWNLSSVL